MNGSAPSVVIIGAGMSGLCMAIKLKQAGVDRVAIFEKGASVGGTWRDNTYPGLSCDVPSHYYSYSFEPNPDWTYRFSPGAEIRQYFERVADKYGLRTWLHLNEEVSECRYEHDHWVLESKSGRVTTADVVVSACGVLRRPKLPTIQGLDSFAGAAFHSARWDHGVELDGKRIGVIGTGSTGAQIVTALAKRAGKLSMFQRTAQWIVPVPDHRYSPLTKVLLRRVPGLARLLYRYHELIFEKIAAIAVIRPGWQRRMITSACKKNLVSVRDPELRRKLTPDYEPMCKRLILSDGFYEAVQRDTCEVVTSAIDHVEPEGVVTADGRLHPLDVLVLATGFDAQAFMRPMRVVGEDGMTIDETWRDRAVAYRTVAVPGFPNFFMMMGPNSPIGNFSLISIAETQADYIVKCIKLLRSGERRRLMPRSEATERLEQERRAAMDGTVWTTGCQSWYLDRSGTPALWPWTPARFRRELARPLLDEFE